MSVFDQYARCYDLLYRDKDYAAEAAYVDASLQRFVPGAVRILEFGSGTGIHGRLLAQKGYHLDGIERSPEMIARAAESAVDPAPGSFTCCQGDICQTFVDNGFDAVISLFHVISYQTSNEDLLAVFRNADRHLKKGGALLFDVWYTPSVLTQRPAVRVKRVEDDQIRLVRIAEPIMYSDQNVVEVRYTLYVEEKSSGRISTFTEVHPMRHFSLPELDLLAAQSGFSPVHCEEFLSGNRPDENTWGVWSIWRKL
ncbi:MAG: class I SAM-dependent methyltransferase [Chloroflexi bacterium]|nr:class I SAM-dependent methyltransferase [Chloroflexota bacterium]